MLRRDCCGHIGAAGFNKRRRLCRRDMFKDDFEIRELRHQRHQTTLDKHRFAIKDIDARIGNFAVDEERHPDPLHCLQCGRNKRNFTDAVSRIGRRMRGVELCSGKNTLRVTVAQHGGINMVGQITGHQRREVQAIWHSSQNPLPIGARSFDARYGRHEIGHDDGTPELTHRIGQHRHQHRPIAHVNVPIIRAADRQAVSHLNSGLGLARFAYKTHAMAATTLSDRALIRLSGDDVRGFLQGLITNDVLGELPVWAGLLTPQGKALFDFLVWADGDDLLIDCERDQADALAKRLSIYRLRRQITIARDEALAVHWSLEGATGFPDPRLAALGQRWIAAPSEAATGWHAHRLSHGVAEGVAEFGQDKTLWLETNAAELNGVSFTKGCYIGQENTARMNYRHKINRRLFVLPDGRVERRATESPGDAIIPDWLASALHHD